MHQKFADWYRLASAAPTVSELEARFSAAESACEHLRENVGSLFDLVEVVFELGRNAKDVQWFIDAVKSADPTLPLEGNENGLAVLAGCTLALLLDTEDPDWSDLATVIGSASFQGTRRPKVLPSLIELAESNIARHQVANRRIVVTKIVEPKAILSNEIKQSLSTLAEDPNPEVMAKCLSDLATNAGPVTTMLRDLQKSITELGRQTKLQREELDMVWTVLGGWVPALNAPFKDVKRSAAGIVIGHQLADFTLIYPAPFALNAIIDRALAQFGVADQPKITIEAAISAMPPTLLKAWSLSPASVDKFGKVTPLLLGMTKAQDDDDNWKRAFAKVTGLQPTLKMSIRELARQAYDERLLIKWLS